MSEAGRRHEKLSDLFLAASELDEAMRRHFLDEQCAGDPAMRAEIERMIAFDRDPPAALRPGTLAAELQKGLRDADGRVGRFRILRTLGEGGMGIVLLGEQERPVRRKVAIKLARLGLETREMLARFDAERQALARLNHPNIAQVYDAGVTDHGRPYFVMEYVEGPPITRYCDSTRLGIAQRVELLRAVCSGVQHAHQRAIIHRDITPSNVLVATTGEGPVPKIIDFGIAKALDHRLTERTFRTARNGLLGTPAYMSPEQLGPEASDVDTRTDVYSLGALLYELLVGVPPLGGTEPRSLTELVRLVGEQEPVKPSAAVAALPDGPAASVASARGTDATRLARQLRGELDWITLKALDKDPGRRYGSPAELSEDLGRHLAGEPVVAGPPSRTYRLGKFVRKRWLSVGLLASIGVLLIASSVALSLLARRLADERDRANQEAAAAHQMLDFVVNMIGRIGPDPKMDNLIPMNQLVESGPQDVERGLEGQPLSQARVLDLLSRVYETWDPPAAVELSKEAIAKLELALGPDHPDVLERKYSFAKTRLDRFELDEAQPMLEQVLAARQRLLGPDHEDTLRVLCDLAWLAKRRGRYDEAIPMFERVLSRQRSALGETHPETLHTLGLLAGAIIESGRYSEGRSMLLDELDVMRRELGAHDRTTLIAHFNIATASSLLGDTGTALRHLRIALEGGFRNGVRLPDGRVLFDTPAFEATLHDPVFASLRGEDAFRNMVGENGYLHDYQAALWAPDAKSALEHLGEAVRKGFSDVERIAGERDFERLRDLPEFREILADLRRRDPATDAHPEGD